MTCCVGATDRCPHTRWDGPGHRRHRSSGSQGDEIAPISSSAKNSSGATNTSSRRVLDHQTRSVVRCCQPMGWEPNAGSAASVVGSTRHVCHQEELVKVKCTEDRGERDTDVPTTHQPISRWRRATRDGIVVDRMWPLCVVPGPRAVVAGGLPYHPVVEYCEYL